MNRTIRSSLMAIFVGFVVAGFSDDILVAAIAFIVACAISYVLDRRSGIGATPCVLWFTGLSGSGKSTIADALYEELQRDGLRLQRLDGDSVREVFPQTGFTKQDRDTHVKQMGFMASLLERHGTTVIASFVSPYADAREFSREQCENFIEVHVATSLQECEQRDVKGLYKRARAGEIKNFTGIDDPYEVPKNAEITLATNGRSVSDCVSDVLRYLNAHNYCR